MQEACLLMKICYLKLNLNFEMAKYLICFSFNCTVTNKKKFKTVIFVQLLKIFGNFSVFKL